MTLYDTYQTAAATIRSQHSGDIPKTAIILGSGLGSLADAVADASVIAFADIPGFPQTGVAGHKGRMVIGHLDGSPLICLQGRVHAYEGHPAQDLVFATRVLWALGVETLIVTNAAGSLMEDAGPGSLMMITDHINMSGVNPLVGENDDRLGVRFPDMGDAWNADLRGTLRQTATDLGITLHEGVYLMVKGPSFETPAEIRAFRTLGASAVGMSTVPECLAANHLGMKVVGVSSITNYAAGMTDGEITHSETMHFGAIAAETLTKLLMGFIAKLA